MSDISIKDIYVGKPDAKDEINFDGLEGFISTLVIPDSFRIDGFLHGNHCFITGYKGTGKTALLFYLDYLLKIDFPHACSSFIFFKDEFTETKKQELEKFSNRFLSSVTFDNSVEPINTDFEHIWRWIFFKRIVSDNEEYNMGLFVEDENFRIFKKTLDRVKAPSDKKRNIIPQKISVCIPFKDPSSNIEISPEIEVSFEKTANASNYNHFTSLIDKAEIEFSRLNRTETPYYIFVDELEAYFGDESVFKRDLCLIRDLLFTVKRINGIFAQNKSNAKIICSVRAEILNAISRFVVTKEINKITNGFEVPLIWNYSNTSSYMHPVIQILLRRIYVNEPNEVLDYKDIYNRWLPEKIHEIEPANYILNNCWNKPRDIVRLISSAQNSIKSNDSTFNQSVFDALRKKYSTDSLIELKEEMRALYTTEEVELIISCFTGFKSIFSLNDLKSRVANYYPNSILATKLLSIVHDLYRLGFLGNYMQASQTYRWQHKGDDGLIITDEWRMMIHYALQGALSVGRKQDIGLSRTETFQKGDIVNIIVVRVNNSSVTVTIDHYGKKHKGIIFSGKLNMGYVIGLREIVKEGDRYRAKVLGFNRKFDKWDLSLENVKQNDEEESIS